MQETNPTTLMIINLLLALVLAGVSWWVRNIWQMVIDQQKAHNATVLEFQRQIGGLTLELGRDYMPRRELNETLKRLFDKLEEIQGEMQRNHSRPRGQ